MVKNLPANAGDAGDMGLILGLGIFLGVGNGNPLKYSCMENPINRGAYSPCDCKKLDMTEHTALKMNIRISLRCYKATFMTYQYLSVRLIAAVCY